MDMIWHWILNAALNGIPTWLWVVIAGAGIGVAWRFLGWQGVLGAVAAVVTLGAYRQGYRDRSAGEAPRVPVDVPTVRKKTPPKAKPPGGKKLRYNNDTQKWE